MIEVYGPNGLMCDGGATSIPLVPGDIINVRRELFIVTGRDYKYRLIHCIDCNGFTHIYHQDEVKHSGYRTEGIKQALELLREKNLDTGYQE